jgi:AraC family transcriptional regulator
MHQIFRAVPLHDHQRAVSAGIRFVSGRLQVKRWQGSVTASDEECLSVCLHGAVDIQAVIRQRYHGVFAAGQMALMPRGSTMTQEQTGQFDCVLFFFAPHRLGQVALQANAGDPARVELIEHVATPDPLIYAIGHAFLHALQTDGVATDLYLESLTQTLIVHLLRSYAVFPATPERQALAPVMLRRLEEYIHAHPQRNLTLAELAAVVGLSPYHLTRLFRRHTGQSLHQYVLSQRLMRAKRLLETTDQTITQIADELGFADHSHLCRQFKRRFGAPPGVLRRERKIVHHEDGG